MDLSTSQMGLSENGGYLKMAIQLENMMVNHWIVGFLGTRVAH